VTGTVVVDCASIDGQSGNVPLFIVDTGAEIIIDNSVSQMDNVLTANAAGLSYQWLDCDNGNTPIAGAEDQTYTAMSDGNYAVVITDGNCSATSDCVNVIINGVTEVKELGVSFYPNPMENILTIDTKETVQEVRFSIVTVSGQVVFSKNYTSGNQFKLDVSNLSAGMYILNVQTEENSASMQIIKQ
jgi:hypothetical protein